MMSLGVTEMYEPVIDKDYSDEEIEELYQKALDRYVEDERAEYDAPPVMYLDEDGDPEDLELFRFETEEYENREPFDEDEAAEEFEEMYRDNLDEPDEDLPDWVREAVDPRILAMYFMPEKIYRKLADEDKANEEKFDVLDGQTEEAFEEMRGDIPDELEELMDTLGELEDSYVLSIEKTGNEIEMKLEGWDEDGEEAVYTLRFDEVEVLEDEGVEAHSGKDEDGDTESDCELLYSEMYIEDGKPEFHMMFDNNGLKYLTFRCEEAYAYMAVSE
jgi:hypothetical protein